MKDIPGFEGRFAITPDGRVWSYQSRTHRAGWRKTYLDPAGYPYVCLRLSRGANGKSERMRIHRLVAAVYLSPQPTPKHEINHRDGNKANNQIDNLEWVTRRENMQHAHTTGLRPRTAAQIAAWERNRLLNHANQHRAGASNGR